MNQSLRIACLLTVAGACATSAWSQQNPPAPGQDVPPPQQSSQAQKPAEQKPSDGSIVVTPIDTNVGAQADAAKLDAAAPKVPVPNVALSNQKLDPETRMLLIRGIQAEFVFIRRTFPFAEGGLTMKANTNEIRPEGTSLQNLIAKNGAAARPGDKGQITGILFKDRAIVFELNGGPKKKTKWYQRIEVGGSSGTTPIAPGPDNTMAHGSTLTLEFDKYIPELTPDQVKQLLAPVFDFSSKSATQAYSEIMPPKVRQALKDHKALVGMNHDMVVNAKGRPAQKVREHAEDGSDYEEWIYGEPPQDVEFVRFVGDEVVMIKDMPMGGQMAVRTDREVDFPPGQVPGTSSAALAQVAGAQQPATQSNSTQGSSTSASGPKGKPSLRRPGDPEPDDPGRASMPSEEKRYPKSPPINPGDDSQPPRQSPVPGVPFPNPGNTPPGTGVPGQPTPPLM